MKKLLTYAALLSTLIYIPAYSYVTCPDTRDIIVKDKKVEFKKYYPYKNNWYMSSSYIGNETDKLVFSKAMWSNYSIHTHVTCLYVNDSSHISSIVSMQYKLKNKEPTFHEWNKTMDIIEFYRYECKGPYVNLCGFLEE